MDLSSIIGFTVMALASMPIFVTFGTLTAVMIVFSLLVSLLVLPSDEYDPHSRATALQHAGQAD